MKAVAPSCLSSQCRCVCAWITNGEMHEKDTTKESEEIVEHFLLQCLSYNNMITILLSAHSTNSNKQLAIKEALYRIWCGVNSTVRDYPVVLNIDGACAPSPR